MGDNDDVAQRAGFLANAGETVVFGATEVINEGDEVATLTAAGLVGDVDPADASVSSVRVVDQSRWPLLDLLGAGPWPFENYPERSTGLQSFRLAPGAGAELLFIVEVKRNGNWSWSETELQYEVNGTKFKADTDFGFAVCQEECQ